MIAEVFSSYSVRFLMALVLYNGVAVLLIISKQSNQTLHEKKKEVVPKSIWKNSSRVRLYGTKIAYYMR